MLTSILVVEDQDEVRAIYEAHLKSLGYRVIPAATAIEGLHALYTHSPDLVLMETQLPEITGWDLLQIIRDSGRWGEVPVIAVTGGSDPLHIGMAHRQRETFCMDRPVDLHELTQMVDRVLVQTFSPSVAMVGG